LGISNGKWTNVAEEVIEVIWACLRIPTSAGPGAASFPGYCSRNSGDSVRTDCLGGRSADLVSDILGSDSSGEFGEYIVRRSVEQNAEGISELACSGQGNMHY
jgi:hypothetical protein